MGNSGVFVYLDKKYIGSTLINDQLLTYNLPISEKLKPGIHTLTFEFSKSLQPAKFLPNNQDTRFLSAFITDIQLIPLFPSDSNN